MSILGIDPGKDGGLALRGRDDLIVEVMPTREDGEVDLVGVTRWIRAYADEIEMAYLEEPIFRLKQRLQDCGNQWRRFGEIRGILEALGIPYRLVKPTVWSAPFVHHVKEKDKSKRYRAIKQARKEIAARLFPGIDLRENERCTTAHEGMVDALLLAEWAYRLRKGNV